MVGEGERSSVKNPGDSYPLSPHQNNTRNCVLMRKEFLTKTADRGRGLNVRCCLPPITAAWMISMSEDLQ